MRRGVLAAVAVCGCLAVGCSRGADIPPVQAIPAASTPAAGETVPHGDHNPHFGGLVLMNGDLHFEVVLARASTSAMRPATSCRRQRHPR